MSFPLIILLVFYLIFGLIILLYFFFLVYHAWKFGFKSMLGFWALFLFIAALSIVGFFSYEYLKIIDWSTSIAILGGDIMIY